MTEPLHPEVAIMNAALELPPDQRAKYLDGACGNDQALRSQVAALLAAHEAAPGFLDLPLCPRPEHSHGDPGDHGPGPLSERKLRYASRRKVCSAPGAMIAHCHRIGRWHCLDLERYERRSFNTFLEASGAGELGGIQCGQHTSSFRGCG